MSSLTVLPASQVSVGTWDLLGGASSIVSVLQGLSVGGYEITFPPSGSYSITCNPGSTILLGATPTTINNLPTGFNLNSLSIYCYIGTGNAAVNFSALTASYHGSLIVSRPNVSNSGGQNIGIFGNPITYNNFIDYTTLYTGSWVFNVTVANGSQTLSFPGSGGFYLTGTYTTLSHSWTVSNVSHSGNPANTNDIIMVSGTGGALGGVLQLGIIINGKTIIVPASQFLTQSPNVITFMIPPIIFTAVTYGTTYTAIIELFDPGTNFTGWAIAQTLSVKIANVSGVYSLVPGQYYDILINRTAGTSSVNQMIPMPYFKTGFIGE